MNKAACRCIHFTNRHKVSEKPQICSVGYLYINHCVLDDMDFALTNHCLEVTQMQTLLDQSQLSEFWLQNTASPLQYHLTTLM